jgi:hypothetical protein
MSRGVVQGSEAHRGAFQGSEAHRGAVQGSEAHFDEPRVLFQVSGRSACDKG